MYCFNCRTSVADNYNQCPYCGGILQYDPAEGEESNLSTMILGIVAAALSCTFYLSFLGIIFGAIAVAKSKKFIRPDGSIGGRAKAGRICGMVGIIAGAVLTFLLIVLILAVGSFIVGLA